MTNADPLPPTVLSRKAIVYVRQSTQTQVQVHLESQRRQYDLIDEARRHGFRTVEVIDDDLGRSASGTVARPGFEKLVAGLCAGEVGAVLCFDASRLARNGRDWHHLLELCGLVDARVIDPDGVYNPCRPNDRLLLGMKGSISEFELGVLRSRMLDAARSKARRGELRISVPIGFVWHREIGLGLDPDCRVQEITRGIFQRFRELGSARQVHLALKAEQVHFPRPSDGKRMTTFDWTPIRYRNVISVLKNPFYAGAYAYGKSINRTQIVDGRARKTYGHYRPLRDCEILLKDHHEGYIELDNNSVERAMRPVWTRGSLCISSSSIWKHWKLILSGDVTRAPFTTDRLRHGRCVQVHGPNLERLAGNNLLGAKDTGLDQLADSVAGNAASLSGLAQGQPGPVLLGGLVGMDAADAADRADPVRCPGLALPGRQSHPVESGGNVLIRPTGRHATNDRQGVVGGAAGMFARAGFTQAQFGVLSAFPMDDQDDLPRRLVDIDHDLVDEGAHQLLAAAHGDVGVLPCRLEVLVDASQIRHRWRRRSHRYRLKTRLAVADAA
jgi:DNA invertase Pin-like site-specific DNA recombinase